MQIGANSGNPRSESIGLILLAGVILGIFIWLLPPDQTTIPENTLSPFDSAEVLVTGTITLAVLVLVIALPLAFACAVFIHVLPQPLKRRVFTLLLLLAQSPLFLWGFAAAVPLLASNRIWPMTGLAAYLSAVLGILSFPRLTIQILTELESMPSAWEETIQGLGASNRQLYWSLILPVARSACFRNLFRVMAATMAEGAVSLLILGPSTTLAAEITGGLVGKETAQLLLCVSRYKVHLLILVLLHTLAQLGSRWNLVGGERG